jgi:hypothetical protein
MLHKEFWGLLFLGFVVWIFMASDGQARIARTCRPMLWSGNIAVSLTAFASPATAETVQKWSNKLDYGCRYTVWRLIYQDDYNKYIQSEQGSVTGTTSVTEPAQHLNTTTAPPAAAPVSPAAPAPSQQPGGVTPVAVAPVS